MREWMANVTILSSIEVGNIYAHGTYRLSSVYLKNFTDGHSVAAGVMIFFFFLLTEDLSNIYIFILLSTWSWNSRGMVLVFTPWIEPWHSRARYYRLYSFVRSCSAVLLSWVIRPRRWTREQRTRKAVSTATSHNPRRTRSPATIGSAAAQQPTIASPARHRFSCPPTRGRRRSFVLALR